VEASSNEVREASRPGGLVAQELALLAPRKVRKSSPRPRRGFSAQTDACLGHDPTASTDGGGGTVLVRVTFSLVS